MNLGKHIKTTPFLDEYASPTMSISAFFVGRRLQVKILFPIY